LVYSAISAPKGACTNLCTILKEQSKEMKYDNYIPSDILKPFVRSLAVQETAEETTYNVLPDTGLVIGFQFKGRLSRLQDGLETPLSVSGVSGLADHSRIFKNTPSIGTVLVFFKEAGATQFFRQPLHELFRESVSLDNFMLRSELLCLEDQLIEAKTDMQRIAAVEKFLISRMTNTELDKLVLAALALIHKSKGNIRISELTEQLHIGQSPLEKRFRQAVGASPKKFASIVRLKNVIQQYDSVNSLTELGYEAGFYDQAHFIKEFKTFTGCTPEKYFSSKK
jgi:AraC-like DNA-binding protein